MAKMNKTTTRKTTKPKATPEKMSGLDAAAKVLAKTGVPMNAKAIAETALAKGYWATKGATPWATLYSAMIRDMAAKGNASRFRKTARGMFESAQ